MNADGSGAMHLTLQGTHPDWQSVPPVGGFAIDLDGGQAGLALEAPGSPNHDAGVLTGIAAAVMASAVSLAGAAWYARRRRSE